MEGKRVLDGWKSISAYLGRTAKTCRKWEHELGLPVHRLDDSSSAHVFAYTDELDRWRKEKLQGETISPTRSRSGLGRKAGFWVIASTVIVAAVVGILFLPLKHKEK